MYSGLLSFPSTTKEKHIWGLSELKKVKMKWIEPAGGERAEQLEQQETTCCQTLDNLLNWEATLALSLKNSNFILRGV